MLPWAPFSNNHPSTTPTACPGHTTGSLLTTHAAPRRCKRTQDGEFNKSGFSSGRHQHHTQPILTLLTHLLVQILSRSTNIYGSRSRR